MIDAHHSYTPHRLTFMTPNARGEPRPAAGARHERRLLGVGSSAWLGAVHGDRRRHAPTKPTAWQHRVHETLLPCGSLY
jgi:hypothetical protein